MHHEDASLLKEYARTGSEEAFGSLVVRHIGLVYSAARRQVKDPQAAQDVTQIVFISLARKAATLVDHPALSGWLLLTTRYAANAHIRAAARRSKREQEAAMQLDPNDQSAGIWPQLEPLLDEGMASLSATDRAILALRYFENKTAGQIAQALNLNEEAAKKRAQRALDKLRLFFSKQGVPLTASALAVAISANAVQPAPAGLVTAITAPAVTAAGTASAVALSATKTLIMNTIQKVAVAAALALTTTVAVYQTRQAAISHHEASVLKEREAELTAQMQSFTQDAAPNSSSDVDDKIHDLQTQVEQLKAATERAARAEAELAALKSKLQKIENPPPAYEPTSSEVARRIEEAVANRVARLQARLSLTGEQTQSISNILRETDAGYIRNSRIRPLLSSDQQAEYEALIAEELRPSVVVRAGATLAQLQNVLGLTTDQQDQVFAGVFQSLMTNTLQISRAANSAEARALVAQMNDQQASTVDALLTPDQLNRYHDFLSKKPKRP